jgi:hypothetical protein
MLRAPFEAIDWVWALPVLEIDPDGPPSCGKDQIGPWICGLPPILNSPAHFERMSVSSNWLAPQARCAPVVSVVPAVSIVTPIPRTEAVVAELRGPVEVRGRQAVDRLPGVRGRRDGGALREHERLPLLDREDLQRGGRPEVLEERGGVHESVVLIADAGDRRDRALPRVGKEHLCHFVFPFRKFFLRLHFFPERHP